MIEPTRLIHQNEVGMMLFPARSLASHWVRNRAENTPCPINPRISQLSNDCDQAFMIQTFGLMDVLRIVPEIPMV